MEKGLKEQFVEKWERYFPGASLPICFYYTDDEQQGEPVKPHPGMHCLIRELARVRVGESLSFAGNTVGCAGGRHYLGFSQRLRPDFNYFLSCGIPGKLEGERYKAFPELVAEQLKRNPSIPAPAGRIVFKRAAVLSFQGGAWHVRRVGPPVGAARRADAGHSMADISGPRGQS